jgi:hypothetical protein
MKNRAYSSVFSRVYPGRTTCQLHTHRAMQRPENGFSWVMVLLGVAMAAGWLMSAPYTQIYWARFFGAAAADLQFANGTVLHLFQKGGLYLFTVPEIILPVVAPSTALLIGTGLASMMLYAASLLLPERFTPAAYFVRAIMILQFATVVCFAIPGFEFPYAPGYYAYKMMNAGVIIIALIPIVLSLTHFQMDFSVSRKIGLGIGSMVYMFIMVPSKYLLQLVFLKFGTVLFLPVLFIFFGLPVEVFTFIALFSWGMSWKNSAVIKERSHDDHSASKRNRLISPRFRTVGQYAASGALLFIISAFALTRFANGQVTIARTSNSIFEIDSGDGLTSAYASYDLTNSGATNYTELWVEIADFTGGVVGLAANENAFYKVNDLPAGESTSVFYYLTATGPTVVAQSHTINVFEGHPSSGLQIGTSTFTLASVDETIKANANKVTVITSGPNPPGLGGIITVTVQGATGTLGNSKILSYTPATHDLWPAGKLELFNSEIVFTGGNSATFINRLHFNLPNKATSDYTATYSFRLVGLISTPTAISPVGFISSGTQIKHTSTAGFAALPPITAGESKRCYV